MANISSGASGPWSSPSTWTGGVVPGPGDAVTIVGHVVTLDQDIEVESIGTGTAGSSYIEISGSSSWNVVVTGYVRIWSAALNLFYFTSDYTGTCTFNIAEFNTTLSTSSGTRSVFLFDGSAGTVNMTIDNLEMYTNSSGSYPSGLGLNGLTSTHINLTLTGSTVYNGRNIFINRTSGSTPIRSNITINLAGQYVVRTAMSGALISLSQFAGTLTFTERLNIHRQSNGSATPVSITLSTVNETFSLALNGGIETTHDSNSTVSALNASATVNGCSVSINGSVVNTIMSISGCDVTIEGDVIVDTSIGTVSSGRTINISGVNTYPTQVIIDGNVSTTADNTLIDAYSPPNVTMPVFLGYAAGKKEYTISAPYGVPAILGGFIFVPGNKYRMVVYKDDNWPGEGSPDLLSSNGRGPYPRDVKKGLEYSLIASGELELPDQESVRAGVNVGGGVGTALVDSSDLANITGSQIAGLSE